MNRATTSLPVPDSPDATSVLCSVTVNDLLRMMSRMQFHEANVVFDGHGAKDRRPHLSADGGDLDDVARPLLPHERDRGLGDVEAISQSSAPTQASADQ